MSEQRRLSERLLLVAAVIAILAGSTYALTVYLQGPSTVDMKGTLTAKVLYTNLNETYGPAVGITLFEEARGNPLYDSLATNGSYSITVPNHQSYAVAIEFEEPNGVDATCSVLTVYISSWWGNTSLDYNWSCASPYLVKG
jgi:hypothetical protein